MKTKLIEFLYILRHPSDGYLVMKQRKTGSLGLSLLCGFLWFFATVINQQYTNFRFNENDVLNTNVLYVILGTLVVYACFCISNWAVCTLFDGEGALREIFIVTGYGLVPYSTSLLISAIVSHFLEESESAFIDIIVTAGLIYSVLMIIIGMMRIHDYRLKSVLFSVIATLIFTLLIIFMCFLVVTLFLQLYSFINSIADELLTRKLT